jgi:hypothetical protein
MTKRPTPTGVGKSASPAEARNSWSNAMSYYGIRPVDRSCGSYGPGHQMHWIQAKKSWEDEQPMIDVFTTTGALTSKATN